MKRLALLTVFFYVCTFAAPPRAQAVAPVALIAAAAVGTAMMSASIGTYYAQNGVMPQYVTSTANAVASAADAVFQPSYLAKGVYHLFTPESLTTAKDYYLGKAAAVGATLGNIIDHVNDSSSSYSDLRNLLNSNADSTYPDPSTFQTGQTVQLNNSTYRFDSNWSLTTTVLVSNWQTGPYYAHSPPTYWVIDSHLTLYTPASPANPVLFWATDSYYNASNKFVYKVYSRNLLSASGTPDIAPTQSYDFQSIKDALNQADMDAAVANDVRDAIAALPDSKVIPAPAVPSTTTDPGDAPSITAAELAAALQANTLAVANAVAEQAAAIAAANPDDAAAQIAAAQAAAEAAKAAAAAEEAANEPEPEPEPSYPVPSTWYTKTCDLSNGLGSCIDYQQVINATSAFQSTALYQFPNLILQCLGYVEGDGCEYPPKLSVDLFTRFSSGPINIDLSPFESVVKVMKFFFAILCLVGTGKATMTLFE